MLFALNIDTRIGFNWHQTVFPFTE